MSSIQFLALGRSRGTISWLVLACLSPSPVLGTAPLVLPLPGPAGPPVARPLPLGALGAGAAVLSPAAALAVSAPLCSWPDCSERLAGHHHCSERLAGHHWHFLGRDLERPRHDCRPDCGVVMVSTLAAAGGWRGHTLTSNHILWKLNGNVTSC